VPSPIAEKERHPVTFIPEEYVPQSRTEVVREDKLHFLKTHFLPGLLRELADILSGRRRDWSMPPDDLFIRSLQSHLDWHVRLMSSYTRQRADKEEGTEEERGMAV
jgi:hypothetical protein